MFKIVETIEKGSKKLTIVPTGWETNGQLAWPKFRADKLITTGHSQPDDSWFRMTCKLKRNHLLNYQIAEEEMDRMLERDDTEQEEDQPKQKNKRPRVLLPKKSSTSTYYGEDFNAIAADAYSISETLPLPPPPKETPVKIISHQVISSMAQAQDNTPNQQPINLFENNNTAATDILFFSDGDIPQDLNSTSFSLPYKSSDQLDDKLDRILANQAVIMKNQTSILQHLENDSTNQNQTLTLQQLAKLEAILDTLGSTIAQKSCNSTVCQKEIENEIENIRVIDEIDTLSDLNKFEQDLKDRKNMNFFVEKLSIICGRQGTGNGYNNCYVLVDRLFSRKFMTLCSWAGGARDKKEKIPFKVYKNIMNLFFQVIHLSDTKFTVKDCEEFFKNVIRNSTRRNKTDVIRSSAVKRRPKHLNYKKIKERPSQTTTEEEKNSECSSSENESNQQEDCRNEVENEADVEDETSN